MKPARAREWIDALEHLASHQLHPVVLRVLRELLDEVCEGDLPTADEHLRPTKMRVQ